MQAGTRKRLGLEAIGLAPTMGCVVATGFLGWDLRRNQKRAAVMSTGAAVIARDKHRGPTYDNEDALLRAEDAAAGVYCTQEGAGASEGTDEMKATTTREKKKGGAGCTSK